jgi:hypothetical protein
VFPRHADEKQLNVWSGQVQIDSFLNHFADWTWVLLDVPALMRGSPHLDRTRPEAAARAGDRLGHRFDDHRFIMEGMKRTLFG